MQMVSAYLETAAAEKASTLWLTDNNGAFRQDVLISGLIPSDMAQTTWNADKYKESKDSSQGVIDRDLYSLSSYFLKPYILGVGGYVSSHIYHVADGYFTNAGSGSGGADGNTYIPIKRLYGYKTLKYKGKTRTTQYMANYVRLVAAALVNGEMIHSTGTLYQNVSDWTEFSEDVSDLPYIDYIVMYHDMGAPAYKDIILEV